MIVEAFPEDIDELFPLWLELMQQHQDYHKVFKCRPGQEQVLKSELMNRIREKDTKVFAYEHQEQWIGMIVCQLKQSIKGFELSRKGYIGETIIQHKYRQQGIGKELFEAARNWLQDKGADHIELQVSVKNTAAINFWENLGFTTSTRHMVLVIK